MIIAIDGPAGAGKSTLAKGLAKALDFQLVETGALYRAVGVLAREQGVDLNDEPALTSIAESLDMRFVYVQDVNQVWLGDREVTALLRSEQAGQDASKISVYRNVRTALLDTQRTLASARSSVLEGRDIGTVVCPHADVKFFVSASPEVRAERRAKELKARGETAVYQDILRDIQDRDHRDATRTVAPLVPADDAIRIDTSTRGIDAILAQMLGHIDAA